MMNIRMIMVLICVAFTNYIAIAAEYSSNPIYVNNNLYVGGFDKIYIFEPNLSKVGSIDIVKSGAIQTLTINGSQLFAGNGREVFDVNLINNAVQWTFKPEGVFTKNMAAFIVNKSNLIVTSTRNVTALNLQNGKPIWKVAGIFGTAPIVFNGNILAIDKGTETETLLVIDANNGQTLRQMDIHNGSVGEIGMYNNKFIYNNLYWPDDVNFPKKIDEAFESLNFDTGKHDWKLSLGELGMQGQTCFIGASVFYVSQNDVNSTIYLSSIDLSVGRLIWKVELEKGHSFSNMIIDENSIIIVVDKRIYKIDKSNGNIIKTLQLDFVAEHILIAQNAIICVGENRIDSVNLP